MKKRYYEFLNVLVTDCNPIRNLDFYKAGLVEFEFCWQATKNKGSKRTTNKNNFFLIFIESLSCIHIFMIAVPRDRGLQFMFF